MTDPHDFARVRYVDTLRGIAAADLQGFFVGWPARPTPETLLRVLQGSGAAILAIDGANGRVIGFINALTDGVLMGYIPLLEVLPAYQGHGIGSELVRRMHARLAHLYGIDLLCDFELRPFYERLGMQAVAGMALRRRGWAPAGGGGDEPGVAGQGGY